MAVYFFVELQLEQRYNFVGTIEGLVNAVALIGDLHGNFKSDWKLFRACIAEWQENYMERLVKVDMLNGNGNASDWISSGSWKSE